MKYKLPAPAALAAALLLLLAGLSAGVAPSAAAARTRAPLPAAFAADLNNSGPIPGIVVDKSPDFATTYVGSPTIAILPDGTYVAAHDWFGRNNLNHTTLIFSSYDKGKTWTKLAEFPFFWGNLFVHKNDLYLLGTLRPMPPSREDWSHYAIRKSTDGGKTWTNPTDSKSGLIRTNAHYMTGPCPIVIHNGRIWRAVETRLSDKDVVHLNMQNLHWNYRLRAIMSSAPVDSDLLDAKNWTLSEAFFYDSETWPVGNGFLEGNAVIGPDGKVLNILRCAAEGRDKAIILEVSEDGKKLISRSSSSQIDFPGGGVKFTIRYDEKSKLYWTLATQQKSPMSTRNYLVLLASKDLINWEQRTVLLRHYDWVYHAFQYVDWVFDGDDILYVSRTAWDHARRAHDANYMTFHRAENFRALTAKDNAPWLGKNIMKHHETKDFIIDGTFTGIGTLTNGASAFSNRRYQWQNVPAKYEGWKYLLTHGGEIDSIRTTPKNKATIYMISQLGADIPGWTPTGETIEYNDRAATKAGIFTRQIRKDFRTDIHQQDWIGGILIWKE